MSQPIEPREMVRHVEWPFLDGRFPAHLGAFVQTTILSGELPAQEVVHTDDNSWLIGDGVNDPNALGAGIATHIWHAIEWNSSITDLADLALGYRACRDAPGHPWTREPHVWAD